MNRTYHITSSKVKSPVTLFLLTDLHYWKPEDLKKYAFVLEKIKSEKPDFLCLGGDILDSAEVQEEEKMIELIETWAKETKILIGFGNHDMTIVENDKVHNKWNTKFWNEIKKIENVIILDNTFYETEELRFIGLTLPYSYYYEQKDKTVFLREYINSHFPIAYGNDKMNILLVHSSQGFTSFPDLKQIPVLNTIDLILSGHTHNGMVPKVFEWLFQNKGLISPSRKLFPSYVRGKFCYQNMEFIVSGGVTKLSERSGLNFFDRFWKHELTKIIISPKENKNA